MKIAIVIDRVVLVACEMTSTLKTIVNEQASIRGVQCWETHATERRVTPGPFGSTHSQPCHIL